MVDSPNKLYETLSSSKEIKEEVTELLKDYDTLPSNTSQAALNNMLIDLRHRLENEGDVVVNGISGKDVTTPEKLDEWVDNNIGEYSRRMYYETLKNKR